MLPKATYLSGGAGSETQVCITSNYSISSTAGLLPDSPGPGIKMQVTQEKSCRKPGSQHLRGAKARDPFPTLNCAASEMRVGS